jgi:hypothetical protein
MNQKFIFGKMDPATRFIEEYLTLTRKTPFADIGGFFWLNMQHDERDRESLW